MTIKEKYKLFFKLYNCIYNKTNWSQQNSYYNSLRNVVTDIFKTFPNSEIVNKYAYFYFFEAYLSSKKKKNVKALKPLVNYISKYKDEIDNIVNKHIILKILINNFEKIVKLGKIILPVKITRGFLLLDTQSCDIFVYLIENLYKPILKLYFSKPSVRKNIYYLSDIPEEVRNIIVKDKRENIKTILSDNNIYFNDIVNNFKVTCYFDKKLENFLKDNIVIVEMFTKNNIQEFINSNTKKNKRIIKCLNGFNITEEEKEYLNNLSIISNI